MGPIVNNNCSYDGLTSKIFLYLILQLPVLVLINSDKPAKCVQTILYRSIWFGMKTAFPLFLRVS